jgi:PAS domain S-box-containing protein
MPIASLRALESVVDEIAIGIQRKRTESTLVAAHARLAEALETMTDGFYATDENFCFTYVNRVAEDWWGVRRENILGRELWHVFPETVGTESQKRLLVAMNERRTVQFEGLSATTGQWTEATIIPTSGGVSVYFRDITLRRQKELARDEMLQYEQNIARQLQQALQPQLPEGLPGLALSHYYKPALPEAGVGGDFYDAFVIDKGCAVLVVGDLSGKGLAAATQVATIRNMLRYALYNQRTLVDAVNTLNDTLAEYKLLTGFATLFVGCYDSGAQTLTYVNCGQEPALIRRAATGEIEALHPTGTVLGSFSGTQFQELVVPMSNDDAIAIFTDGFTESGPTRRELLGIEGVTDILKRPLDEGPGNTFDLATELSRRLVSEVTTYARDGASDDMCLLVAVANQPAFV